MNMIKAIVRPERVERIVTSLEDAGFPSLTKIDVFGRGKQKGITIGKIHYDELPKVMLIIVADDDSMDKVIDIILSSAKTGSFGDGKIFVTPVEKVYTIRTGEQGL